VFTDPAVLTNTVVELRALLEEQGTTVAELSGSIPRSMAAAAAPAGCSVQGAAR
jgi:hypothetical protein